MKKPTLYLTFDDGPFNPETGVVLSALRKNEVRATFFLCSDSLEQQDNGISESDKYKFVKGMLDDGHALANHGDDHLPRSPSGYQGMLKDNTPLRQLERQNFERDVFGADKVPQHVLKDFEDNASNFERIFRLNGKKFPGFMGARLPGSGKDYKDIVRAVVARTGVPHFGWHVEFAPNKTLPHVNSLNWCGIFGVSSTIKNANDLQDQCIVLMHDEHWRGREKLLTQLVGKLKELGQLELLPAVLPKTANKLFKREVTFPSTPQGS